MRQVKARDLYGRMMRTLAQTGNGWMTFKDAANRTCNQTGAGRQRGAPVQPVHRDHRGLLRHRDGGLQPRLDQPGAAPDRPDGIDWDKLRATVRTAVPFLDRVIDINYYPSAQAAASNPRWRPVGLGRDGAAGRLLRAAACRSTPPRRCELSTRDRRGDLPDRAGGLGRAGRAARRAPGLRRDPGRRAASCSPTCGASTRPRPSAGPRCGSAIAAHGLRNSLLIAIAPTATIASIAGCYECIEPQVSNLFKRETLSGEFLQINARWCAS